MLGQDGSTFLTSSDKNNVEDSEKPGDENIALVSSGNDAALVKTKPDKILVGLSTEIVQREIEIQKRKVKEQFHIREASGLDLTEGEEKKNSVSEEIFPTWLRDREDFQYVFPRFSKTSRNEINFVAFAISKEPKMRTSFDIETTVNFLRQFLAFSSLPEELCKTLCKFVRLVEKKAGMGIFEQANPAHSWYVLLRGKVELRNKNSNVTKVLQPGSSFGDNALSDLLDEAYGYTASTIADDSLLQRNHCLVQKKRQQQQQQQQPVPDSMDEAKANENPDLPVLIGSGEKDTIIMLELGAQDYRSSCKMFNQSQSTRISKFLQTQVKLFSKWSKHRVNQVAPLLRERSFRPGELIQRTGDPADELYFLYEGVCQVQKEISKMRTNKWPKSANEKRKLEYDTREVRSVKNICLANLHPGDYFGEDFLIGYADRQTTVISSGFARVFVLPRGDVQKIFTSRMLEEMKTAHKKLFISDEAIMAKHEREHRLRQEFNHLKLSSLGPAYQKRMELKKTRQKLLKASKSTPELRPKPKRNHVTRIKRNDTNARRMHSSATMPLLMGSKQIIRSIALPNLNS